MVVPNLRVEKELDFSCAPYSAIEDSAKSKISKLNNGHLKQLLEIEKLSYPNPWSEALIAAEIESRVGFSFVLEAEGSLVAYCFAHLVAEDIEILNICVCPKMRGRGYASKLLSSVLSEAVLKGAKIAHLEVRPSNAAALRLYKQFLFKRVAVRLRYYSDNKEDAWIMSADII